MQTRTGLREILRADRWVILLSAVFCSLIAVRLNLPSGDSWSFMWQYPLSYKDDGLAILQTTRKLMDGWVLHASRAGYPMGANFHDYPMSDLGSLLFLKLLGALTGSAAASVNIFYLVGYPAASVSAHLVLRLLGMRTWPAVLCSLLFAWMPFHFLRIEHLFLTWYFQIPIYIYAAHKVFQAGRDGQLARMGRSSWACWLLLLAALSSFGLYHAFFGALLICASAFVGWLHARRTTPLWMGGLFALSIGVGLAANVLPNRLLNPYDTPNPEAVQRAAFETEYNGLKLTQLFMPHLLHRSDKLRSLAETYARDFPLSAENHTASLGVIGSLGVLLIIFHIAKSFAQPEEDDIRHFLAMGFLALFMFVTIGGLSTLFSGLVSPVIRCTNRASVFLGFLALATFFFTWQSALARNPGTRPFWQRLGLALGAVALLVFGAWDQSPKLSRPQMQAQRLRFDQDRQFMHAIEAIMPKGAAVFQLPYMAYPESPRQHHLETYALSVGYTHSSALNWSYGGMRGRPEDAYAKQASQMPIGQLARDVVAHGFSGLYIDRRGYADGGKQIEQALRDATGPLPQIVHPAGHVVFYRLTP